MDLETLSLLSFQASLVSSLLNLSAIGVVIIGFGLVVSGVAPVAGYRIKRLGMQVIGACLIVILTHSILVEVYAADIPVAILIGVYSIAALLLLQGALNLLFGPSVGNRVVASLLGSLLVSIVYLAFRPFGLIRGLFR